MERQLDNKSYGILEVKMRGVVNIEDVLNHYVSIAGDKSLPDKIKVLVDLKETRLNINPDELDNYTESMEKALSRFVHIKEAIVVEKPRETAIAMLLGKELSGSKNYFIEIFSTERAAANWLAY